jgi:molecular chaperone GrpE
MTENKKDEEMNKETISEENVKQQTEAEETTAVDEEEVTPLTVAEAEINDLRDKLLRAVAEAENVRRRAEKEKADAANYAVTTFARDMLAVGDNLHRALEALPDDAELSDSVKTLIEGVKMTDRELHNIFERHGINKIDPKGEQFDHNHHQAMFEAPTEDPNGTVIQVMQVGYKIKERLLRPAMVGVSKGGPDDETTKVDTTA